MSRIPVRASSLIAISLVLVLVVAVACGSDKPASGPTQTPGGQTVTPPTPTPTPAGPIVTVTPNGGPAATSTPTVQQLQEQLNAARSRWTASRPQSYSMTQTWHCFCAFNGEPVRISVRGNEIVNAISADSATPPYQPDHLLMTVDQLFDWIQAAIDAGTDSKQILGVEYERDFGYPVSVTIDELVGATDTTLNITIRDFRVGTDDVDIEQARRDMENAMFRWYQYGLESYEFVYRLQCFCQPDETAPVRITVEAGQVTSVVDVATGQVRTGNYNTVQGMFGWISQRLDRNPEYVSLEFNPETGFPTKAQFDYIVNMYDDEEAFFAEGLTRLNIHTAVQEELDAATAKWNDIGLIDYTFEFNWSCFCMDEFTARVLVSVTNGKVSSVTRLEDGEPVGAAIKDLFVPVSGLFARLQRAIDSGAASIQVDFDPVTGIPVSAFIDDSTMIADEEIGWSASDLSPAP